MVPVSIFHVFRLIILLIVITIATGMPSRAFSGPLNNLESQSDNIDIRGVTKNCSLVLTQNKIGPQTDLGEAGMRGAITPNRLIYSAGRYVYNYNRTTCALISRVKYDSIFAFGLSGTILMESDLIYDPVANRCVIYATYKDSPFAGFDQFLFVGISRDRDCTSWNTRMIQTRTGGNYTFECMNRGQVFSRITLGANINRIVLTADMGSAASLLSLDKNALMAGSLATYKCFRNIASSVIVPSITADSENTMMLIAADSTFADRTHVRRWHLATSRKTPASDMLSIMPDFIVGSWQAPPSALQLDRQPLNTGNGRFQTASRQLGAYLWNAHVVKAGVYARSRIYKFAVNETRPLLSYQPSTSACLGKDNLFAPSLDIQSAATNALLFVTVLRTCPDKSDIGKLAQVALRGPNQSSSGWLASVIDTSPEQVQLGATGATHCVDERGGCDIGLATATQRDPSSANRAWTFGKRITGTTVYHWRGRAAQFGP